MIERDAGHARLVWDLPVRVTHWALVLCVAGSWATHYAGVQWFAWHRRCGYAVFVLVAFRILWGFVGTRHARFAGFVRSPRTVLQYLRGGAQSAAGHNPAGGWSVLALLAVLMFQASSGLFANDEIANTGPFYGWISPELSNRISGLHQDSSDLMLVLIALHLVAVAWYVVVRRRPLLRAMWTGRQRAEVVAAGEEIGNSRTALALVLAAAIAAALALAVRAAPESMIALY